MNDDSSLDGGRFDTGTMGDLDRMVRSSDSIADRHRVSLILSGR